MNRKIGLALIAIVVALAAFRARQTDDVMAHDDPRQPL